MSETLLSGKSIKSQRNESDEAQFPASARKVAEEKSKRKADGKRSVPPCKGTMEEKKNKPQSTVPPGKDQPSVVKQRKGNKKPMQPKNGARPRETVPSETIMKSQRNESDKAELTASPKKVPEEKSKLKDDGNKSVPPHKGRMAEKKNNPQLTVPLENDKPPSKKGEESSLASELWQLKRKRSQSHDQLRINKKFKEDFDSSLPRITVHKKATIATNTIEDEPVNKNTDEALDKPKNSGSLGTYLYGLHSSANKKPKRKYLPKKKPMSTTLAFDFNTYYGDKSKESKESISSGLASLSIEGYFSLENSKERVQCSSPDNPVLPLATSPQWYNKQGELSKANAA